MLRLLRSRPGEWIPVAEIQAVAGLQYSARISEARQLGHKIQNFERDGASWFRLIVPPPATPPPIPAEPSQRSMFGDPDRTYRE